MGENQSIIHNQNQVLLYVLLFSICLGVGVEIIVGAPIENLLALGFGGGLTVVLIGVFQYKQQRVFLLQQIVQINY
ncbi:putative membrane protein [Virgibacillus natechei]|uniref:Membrane protein n=1 Tax=Virgibacillus natechei TaxID=1216297 RepID=A0ABS4IDE2_9BACI|nr:hypothetical protein [Virgibacillus natechei]MBP1968959.1 putative membrane protein [Virgibacillus natechei]UZD14239.1 hypothetical protein OLD84_06940 [Virgibacillus natechei]